MAKKGLRCFGCESPLRATYLYCPFCGVRLDSGVTESAGSEPATFYARERPRLFGVPPQDTLLLLGIAALLFAFAAFGTGHLVAGIVLLIVAYAFLGAFAEAVRRRPASTVARKAVGALRGLHRDVEFLAVAVAAYISTRARRTRLWRERRSLTRSRRVRLLELGEAVHEGDDEAVARVREALTGVDAEIAANDAETAGLERRRAQRIRAARIVRAGRSRAEQPTVVGP